MRSQKIMMGIWFFFFSFLCITSAFAGAGKVVANGDVALYKNGKLVKRISGQSVVDEDVLLVCEGKCLFKGQGISLIAGSNASLAVMDKGHVFNLYIKTGLVDFTITDLSKKVAFYTQDGVYSVAEIMVEASNESAVKGYVLASEQGTEVGVRQGKMIFSSKDGFQTVSAGSKVQLAMAEIPEEGSGGQGKVGGAAGIAGGGAAPPRVVGGAVWWGGGAAVPAVLAVGGAAAVGTVAYIAGDNNKDCKCNQASENN